MAILDTVFSGEKSITALLADTFAGNATVICPGDPVEGLVFVPSNVTPPAACGNVPGTAGR